METVHETNFWAKIPAGKVATIDTRFIKVTLTLNPKPTTFGTLPFNAWFRGNSGFVYRPSHPT